MFYTFVCCSFWNILFGGFLRNPFRHSVWIQNMHLHMCHIANAHFSCCPTKIWSSWWWVTLGCKYYAVALCSITWLTHIWPFLHLITYSRLAKPLLSSRMLQHKRLNKRWNKANSVKWKGRKEDERRSAKPGEQQTSSPWSSTLFYSLPEDTWKKGDRRRAASL